MTPDDPVRLVLAARGCPEALVQEGLEGLVERWDAVVHAIEGGYSLTLDDYLNDMDLRDLIAAGSLVASAAQRRALDPPLERADARHHAATTECACLWGDEIADADGLDPELDWWYFRRPVHPGAALREDLLVWGLMDDRTAD